MTMNALAFDTHKAVKTLIQAGAAESLAEAMVATVGSALSEYMATKADLADLKAELKGDIAELKGDITELKAELKGDIAKLKGDLKGDIAKLKGDLKGDITELRLDMKGMEQRLTIRLGALIAAGIAILATLDKLI